MDTPRLKTFLLKVPSQPGVYFWLGSQKTFLYIGKASNLKKRLASYLKTADPRIAQMIKEATALRWQTTETEIEALILESQLIKRHRPKHNIVWRDDKYYSFVALSKETFPKFLVTHRQGDFGPFTDASALKITLRSLRNLFPYCTCKQKHNLKCLNAHIGKCLGFCCLKLKPTSKQVSHYQNNLRAIKDILTGRRSVVIKRIEKEMLTLGQKGDFETALEFKKLTSRLKRVFENAQINRRHQSLTKHHLGLTALAEQLGLKNAPQRIEGYDVANNQQRHAVGAMVVFTDGQPDKAQYRLFNIKTTAGGDTAMLAEILERRLNHLDWPRPDLILVDGSKAQLNAAKKVLEKNDLVSLPVIALTKNDRHRPDYLLYSGDSQIRRLGSLPAVLTNLLSQIDQEAHRFSITRYRRKHRRFLVEINH